MTGRGTTVRSLLAVELDAPRVLSLEAEIARVATRPLADVVADLRGTLTQRITMEDYWRLHILISHLYNHAGADLDLTKLLRDEIAAALTAPSERGGEPHVLPDHRLP